MPVTLNKQGQVRGQLNAREIAEQIVGDQRTAIMREARTLARALYTGDLETARGIFPAAKPPPDALLGRLAGRIGQGAASGVNVTVAGGTITVSTGGGGNANYATWIEGGTRAPDPMGFIQNARKRRTTKTSLVRSTKGTYYYTRATKVGLRERNGSRATIVAKAGSSSYLIVSGKEDESKLRSPDMIPSYSADAYQAAPAGDYRVSGFAGDDTGVFAGATPDATDPRAIFNRDLSALQAKVMQARSAKGSGTKRSADEREMAQLTKAVKKAQSALERRQTELSFERYRTKKLDEAAAPYYTVAPLTKYERYDMKALTAELGAAFEEREELRARQASLEARYARRAAQDGFNRDEDPSAFDAYVNDQYLSGSATYTRRQTQVNDTQQRIVNIRGRLKALQAQDQAPRRIVKRIVKAGGASELRSFITLSTSASIQGGSKPRIGSPMPAYPVMGEVQRFLDERFRDAQNAIQKG